MTLTINTNVLRKYHLSIEQFIVLLTGYYSLDCQKIHDDLVNEGLAERNLFKGFPPILSDNTKNLIARIFIESDPKIIQSGIDFEKLAAECQKVYPSGNKPGTTYPWRGTKEEIAQKLRTLVVKYNFLFTEEEAIAATKEYVDSFKDYKFMSLLRNFILTTHKDEDGKLELNSLFMTIIDNNREAEDEIGGDIGDIDDAIG